MVTFATSANQTGHVGTVTGHGLYEPLTATQTVAGLQPEWAGTVTGHGLYEPLTATQTVAGLQPGFAEHTATHGVGAATRSAVGVEFGAYVPPGDAELPYSSLTATQTVAGLQPDNYAFSVEAESHTMTGPGATYRGAGFDPEASVVGVEGNMNESYAAAAGLIPASWFREVRGRVLDHNGELVDGALSVVAIGALPTVGRVDAKGRFALNLLRSNYTDFMLIQRAPDGSPYDYLRYEVEGNPDLGSKVNEADLRFNTEEPEPTGDGGGVGFYAGGEAFFGG